MKNWKRALAMLSVSVMVAGMLAGCGSSGTTPAC